MDLSPADVRIVCIDGDKSAFAVPYKDDWPLASPDRCDDYVEIRGRAFERIQKWKPDVVCIQRLEPLALRHASAGMIETAELRGILAEAARAAGAAVRFPLKAGVNRNLGVEASAFAKDDTQWAHLGKDFLKKFRPAAVLAVSYIRGA